MVADYNILTSAIINHPVKVGTSVLFTAGLMYLGLINANVDRTSAAATGLLTGLSCTFFSILSVKHREDEVISLMECIAPTTDQAVLSSEAISFDGIDASMW